MRENKEVDIVTKEISYTGKEEGEREEEQEGGKGRGLLNRHNLFSLPSLLRSPLSLQKQNDSFLYTLDIL